MIIVATKHQGPSLSGPSGFNCEPGVWMHWQDEAMATAGQYSPEVISHIRLVFLQLAVVSVGTEKHPGHLRWAVPRAGWLRAKPSANAA